MEKNAQDGIKLPTLESIKTRVDEESYKLLVILRADSIKQTDMKLKIRRKNR